MTPRSRVRAFTAPVTQLQNEATRRGLEALPGQRAATPEALGVEHDVVAPALIAALGELGDIDLPLAARAVRLAQLHDGRELLVIERSAAVVVKHMKENVDGLRLKIHPRHGRDRVQQMLLIELSLGGRKRFDRVLRKGGVWRRWCQDAEKGVRGSSGTR